MDECMPPEGEELFTNNCGLPIQFSMPICPQKEEYRRKIEGHGGSLSSITGGHHTIRLIPPELKSTSSTFDVFSTKYIDDCINGEKLLSLESYRIGKSLYASDISVNDIMMGLRSWKDCTACTAASNNVGEDVVFDDDDDDMLPNPPKVKWKGRRDYEHRERRAILNYIIDNKKYHEVKGRNMWTEMEKAKVCPGRTWESMKEHFRKNIMHNLHLFKIDDKTIRKLTEPFVKGPLVRKERYPSSDSDEEVLSNEEEDVSRKRVKSLDRERKDIEEEEINVNAKGPGRAAEERILNGDDMNILKVQGKKKDSNIRSKKKDKENCISNESSEIEMTSKNDKEENVSPKKKYSESENNNSLALTEMLVEKEQTDTRRQNGDGATGDKDEAQSPVEISGDPQESSEHGQNNNNLSSNQQQSSGHTLPDVISSNSTSENSESTNKSCSNDAVTSESVHSNTQAFDIAYSNEEFRAIPSGLHIPQMNKEHEKSNLPGNETPENFKEVHEVHLRNEVPLIGEVSNATGSSKENGDVCNSLVTQGQTKPAPVIQKSVTDEVTGDCLEEHNENQISNHVLTRNNRIQSPKSKKNDGSLACEKNSGKIGPVRNKTNPRIRKDTTSHQSSRRRNSAPSPEPGDDDASVYGSPLSSTQGEVYESCLDKDQYSNGETTQNEVAQMSDKADLNISSTSLSSITSGDSTIIFPLSNNKTGEKDIISAKTDTGRYIDYKKRQKRLIIDSDSDSDNQREDYQGESSENEVVLKRNSHIRISRIAQNSQKADPIESESDCVSDSFSSDEETYSHPSHASDRNNINGRYDRSFNPKAGCRDGEKRKNGKWKHTSSRLRKQYSMNEDVQILKYIIKHKGYNQVGGNVLWQDMEKSKSIPGRSWHSLKERYRKRIVHHLPIFVKYGFNQSHLKRLSSGIAEIEVERGSQSNTDPTNRKRLYTRNEDYLILKFICENKRHSQIGGKLLWVLMSETVKGLQGRSWLSLKERFRRTILRNLGTYKISDEDRRKFKKSENRRSPGLRLYFKHEKETSSDDDSSSSCSSVRSFGKSRSLSRVKSNKREDLKRGLKSRQLIEKHFGLEPKPSTSGCCIENTTTGLIATSCSMGAAAVSRNSKKRKLYTANSVLSPPSENTRRPRRSSTPKMLNEESTPEPTIADNCNKNQIENFSELEDNDNTEESQAESEEIPLLHTKPSLKSCDVSNNLCRNDAAVMDKSGIPNDASSSGREKEPETSENKVSKPSDSESVSNKISSALELLENNSSKDDCTLVQPLSCEMESDPTHSLDLDISEIETEEEPNLLRNSAAKRNHISLSPASSGSFKGRKSFRDNSFLNLRSSTVRGKLRKRHIRLLKR